MFFKSFAYIVGLLVFAYSSALNAAYPPMGDIKITTFLGITDGEKFPGYAELETEEQKVAAYNFRKSHWEISKLIREKFAGRNLDDERLKEEMRKDEDIQRYFREYIQRWEAKNFYRPERTPVQEKIIEIVGAMSPDQLGERFHAAVSEPRTMEVFFDKNSSVVQAELFEMLQNLSKFKYLAQNQLPFSLSQLLNHHSEVVDLKKLNKIIRGLAIWNHGEHGHTYNRQSYMNHLAAVRDALKRFIGALLGLGSAAYGHDLIEDTGLTREILLGFLPHHTVDMIFGVTNVSKADEPDKWTRKAKTLEKVGFSMYTVALKLADTIANAGTGVFNLWMKVGESKLYKYQDFFQLYLNKMFKDYHPPVIKAMWQHLEKMLFDKVFQAEFVTYQIARAFVFGDDKSTQMDYDDYKETVKTPFKGYKINEGGTIWVPN